MDLMLLTMTVLFDIVYDKGIVAALAQDVISKDYAKVIAARVPILVFESMWMMESCCLLGNFEWTIYDAATNVYQVDKAHMLVKVETLGQLSMQA